jgi:hypothetical protein
VTKRQESLIRWLERWGPFPTELSMTKTAARAMSCSGEELDWLAKEWRKRQKSEAAETAAGPIAAAASEQSAAPADTLAGAGSAPQNPREEEPPQDVLYADGEPLTVNPHTGEIVEEEEVPFEGEPEDDGGGELGRELVPSGELVSLFGHGGPDQALATVEIYADAFKRFVKDHELTLEMEDGADYVLSPGWEALGQLTGVFAEIEWTEPAPGGWKARAFAHRPSTGERWTSREAVATRAEIGKKYKPDSDLLSMAQTRATRNALRAALSVVVNAAGFDSAPPEERQHSPKQRAMLFAIFQQLEQEQPRGKDGWKDWATNGTLRRFGKRISGLNRQEMTFTIERTKQVLEEVRGETDGYEPTEAELAEAEGMEF